jgi:hypothetical protein
MDIRLKKSFQKSFISVLVYFMLHICEDDAAEADHSVNGGKSIS